VTNVGKTGSGLDVKATLPVNRVTDLPSTQRQQIKTNGPAVLKLNNNPPMGNNRPQGNALPGKVSGSFTVNNSANNNARFASMQSQSRGPAQPMGQMRRGF